MLSRPGLALYLAPRELPFILVGGAVAAVSAWSAVPVEVAVAAVFLVAFQVKVGIIRKSPS
jgi:uncharacterized membrane protein